MMANDASRYTYGDRDEVATHAHKRRMYNIKTDRLARPTPEHVHGTINGYSNYDCRCARCRLANKRYREFGWTDQVVTLDDVLRSGDG